jgi:outer membrane autotransporter protein
VRKFDQDRGGDRAGIEDRTGGTQSGFQIGLADNVWGGLATSFETSHTRVNGTSESETDWYQLGGVLKYVQGPWKLSGSLSGGIGDFEQSRSISLPGFATVVAEGDTTITTITGLARLSYSYGETGWYVTPMVDLGANYIEIDGFSETGAGGIGLTVASSDQTIIFGGPAIEIGTTVRSDKLVFRPYAKAGVTFLSEDSMASSARFNGAAAGSSDFATVSLFDDVFADLSGGVQMFSADVINLKIGYEGRLSDNAEQHGVEGKLNINY